MAVVNSKITMDQSKLTPKSSSSGNDTLTSNSTSTSGGRVLNFNLDQSKIQPYAESVRALIGRVNQTPDFISISKSSFPDFTQNRAEELYNLNEISSLSSTIAKHLQELLVWYENALEEFLKIDEENAADNEETPIDSSTGGGGGGGSPTDEETGTEDEEQDTTPKDKDEEGKDEDKDKDTEPQSGPTDDTEPETKDSSDEDNDDENNDDNENNEDKNQNEDENPKDDDTIITDKDTITDRDKDINTDNNKNRDTSTQENTKSKTTSGGGGGGTSSPTSPSVAAQALKNAMDKNQSNEASKKGLSLDANTPRLTSNILNSQGQKNFAAKSLAGAGIALGVAGITGGLFLAKGRYYTFTPEDWDDTEPEVQEAILNNFIEAGMSDSEIEEFKNTTFKIEMKELNEHIKKVEYAYAANEAIAEEFYNMYHFTVFDEDGDVDKYLLFLAMGIDGMFPNADINFYNIVNPYLEEDDINFIYTGINLADYIYDAGEEEIVEDEELEEEEDSVI